MQDSVLYRPFLDLIDGWRDEGAYLLERYGDQDRARLYKQTATDLIEVVRRLPDLEVSYAQGAYLSTLERGSIRNPVYRGALTNVGTRGQPKLLLRSLPLFGPHLFALPDALSVG